jgi:uncharacterized protein YbaP (TraB family)
MSKINSFILALFLGLTSLHLWSSPKYPSLLWEISGNGLQKKSYLYGTMHVSGRIAYHLGEEFYQALNSVDAMALESNPIIWLKEINNSRYADQFLGNYYISSRLQGDFYKNAFQVILPKNVDLGATISASNFLMNWLLYRENKRMADFEEDTFLDMFIYQAGRKNNKPVYSLEDFNQTNVLSVLANLPDAEEKSPSDWFVKMTKDKSYWELIQDAYRKQNLDLLDSLQAEVSGPNYLRYMLHERNDIMVRNIDSLIQLGQSLFCGVGAAHLPGERGMIEGLIKLGYTLTPIKPTITDKAKAEKERLSKLKRAIPMDDRFSTELFSLSLPAPMYETYAEDNLRDFFAPELTNGSFYSASIVSTYAFLSGNAKVDFQSKVDSLLFEYIPGKIISKKFIERDGYKGIDVVNQTKAGDFQRYNIFFSPIHMLIFKMGGKHEWVQRVGNDFFKSITLTPLQQDWTKVHPLKGDFSVHVPGYYSIKNNTKIISLYGQPELEAFDIRDSSFYMVKRGVYQDLDYIEEDAFELNRIIDKFLETLKIDSAEVKTLGTTQGFPSIRAKALTSDGRYIHMLSVIKGAYYYLLVSSEKSAVPNAKFYDSFTFNEHVYLFDKEVFYDSIMRFSVNSNFLTPDPFYQQIVMARNRLRDAKIKDEQDKSYNRSQSESYYSENYEEVKVDMTVFSPYAHIKDVNEYWDNKIKDYTRNEYFYVHNEERGEANGMHYLEVAFADSASSRLIQRKYVLNVNRLYVLTANLDTLSKKSAYVSNFFSTFRPVNEDPNAISVFDDKAKLYFVNIQSEDSLTRDAALKAVVRFVNFDKSHVDEMIHTIRTYPFGPDYINAKITMIKDLGKIEHPAVLPFLSTYYLQVTDTSLYQLAILEALARQKTKKATRLMIKLLDKDIPVSNDSKALETVFRPFYDSLVLTNYLFPDLLNYTFVNKSYEEEIYNLLSASVARGKLNPRVYRRYTNEMIKRSRILVKGERSALQRDKNYAGMSGALQRFANILFPLHRKKQVKLLMDEMLCLNLRFQTELLPVLIANNLKITPEYFNKLTADIKNLDRVAYVVHRLSPEQRESLPTQWVDQERLCRSRLFYAGYSSYDETKDSIVFIGKEWVKTRRQEGWVYFYKTKKEKDDNWTMAYIGIQPKNTEEFTIDLRQSKTRITIPRGAQIADLIRDEIKTIELKDRPRATEDDFGGFDFDFW